MEEATNNDTQGILQATGDDDALPSPNIIATNVRDINIAEMETNYGDGHGTTPAMTTTQLLEMILRAILMQ